MPGRALRRSATDRVLSVLAFDPGGSTGWALFWFPERNLYTGDILDDLEFDNGEIYGEDDVQCRQIRPMLARHDGPLILEDFVLRQFRQDRDLLSPVRMISRIELLNESRIPRAVTKVEELNDAHYQLPLFKQQPAMAKGTATDARMRSWGLWTPGKPHANDATRHCITFIRRARGNRALRLAAWGLAA